MTFSPQTKNAGDAAPDLKAELINALSAIEVMMSALDKTDYPYLNPIVWKSLCDTFDACSEVLSKAGAQ